MAPTLLPGDGLYVDTGAFRLRPPQRGELVVLRDPTEPSRWFVKRVAFTSGGPTPPDGTVVPEGTVYVLGDNASESVDSRRFGPVSERGVLGRVYYCYRPPERRRTF